MDRCPVCRAALGEHPVCRRCKSDLSLPLAIEQQADLCLRLAVHDLSQGNLDRAGESAARAQRLVNSGLAKALAGFGRWLREEERNGGMGDA